MSHKNNKNSMENKKSNQKSKKELKKMKLDISNSVGTNNQSKKLGNNTGVVQFTSSKEPEQKRNNSSME